MREEEECWWLHARWLQRPRMIIMIVTTGRAARPPRRPWSLHIPYKSAWYHHVFFICARWFFSAQATYTTVQALPTSVLSCTSAISKADANHACLFVGRPHEARTMHKQVYSDKELLPRSLSSCLCAMVLHTFTMHAYYSTSASTVLANNTTSTTRR